MILKEQSNFVTYYKVIKETKCYMWIRELEQEEVRTEGLYVYMYPIEDQFKNDEVFKYKKNTDLNGKLVLWHHRFAIKEFDGTNYGYNNLGW